MKKLKILLAIIMVFGLTGCSIKIKDNKGGSSNSTKQNDNKRKAKDNKGTSNNKSYEIGDVVSVNGEKFYVFEDSEKSDGTITLFAMYNLTKDGKKQAVDAKRKETAVEFSSEEYWLEAAKNYKDWDNKMMDLNEYNGNKAGDAITKARDYADSLGAIDGRLITYEEAEELRNEYQDMIGGHDNRKGQEDGDYLDYYTSSVRSFDIDQVFEIRGLRTPTIEVDSALYGVRPIIVISKSLLD